MDPDSSIYAIGVGLCLLVLAFTSAVDAAFSAISRHQLHLIQNAELPRAKVISALLVDPYRFKASVLFLNAGAIIAATAFTLYLTRVLSPATRLASLATLLLLILVFGEALPKAFSTRDPASAARLLAGPMALVARLLQPIIAAVDLVTRPLIRLLSGQASERTPLVTEEELLLLVNVGEEEGLIEPDEREMIEGVFSFGDKLVSEVMIPRVDIKAIDLNASLDDALDMFIAHGHSRLPVYQETIDRIVGVLHIKDVLPELREPHYSRSIEDLLRPAYFVPETMKVGVLLKELKSRKAHLAIAVDEYGGTAGLLTIEDLVEEIVGDIQDEYDVDEPSMQFIAEHELVADARISLDDINDLTGLRLESEESDRLGGLVYEHLGRVPKVGDEVKLDGGVTITVLSVEGLGPRRLQISFPPASQEAEAPAELEKVHDGST